MIATWKCIYLSGSSSSSQYRPSSSNQQQGATTLRRPSRPTTPSHQSTTTFGSNHGKGSPRKTLFKFSLSMWLVMAVLGWRQLHGCLGFMPIKRSHEMYMQLSSFFSLVLFVFYAYDKHLAATNSLHRVPENTLLSIALLGGWMGGVVGSSVWSHKTIKQPYLNLLYAIILLHNIYFWNLALRWVYQRSTCLSRRKVPDWPCHWESEGIPLFLPRSL